ncbi:geobacillin-26 family protein [Anaerocolumna sp. AGMB13020]|uniref:geobacillin-26 family protein n=1 Tax=Anaerocolumna sp. AGMB13020 TaxID=3081750 RepID=UPI002955C055|nr:geobacillin-26 family protein [Anaerocolumna sp. AGMB13020]WOO35789.1 geobacillin-26 family protein [Anaerocolumna sp. AGMB13020]
MSRFKRYFAMLMAIVITLSSSISASAATNNSSIDIEGVTYKLEETINDDGSKTVTVIGNGEINTITNDGEFLHVNTETVDASSSKSYLIDINYDDNTAARYTAKYSLYWNYNYYYDQSPPYGMFWYLESGNDNGTWTGYDYGESNLRDQAYDFCTNVRALDTAQWAASAASGASAGSIAAAIASAGPTAGIGAIIGVVAAILAGGVAVAEWVAAYNCSLDCNQSFQRVKQLAQ